MRHDSPKFGNRGSLLTAFDPRLRLHLRADSGTVAGTDVLCSFFSFRVAAALRAAALRFLVRAAFLPAALNRRVLAAFLPAARSFLVLAAFCAAALRSAIAPPSWQTSYTDSGWKLPRLH